MNLFRFEWPATGPVTATALITSNAISLPFARNPETNQIVNESRSGVRQTAELGNTRETFVAVFPALDQNDYQDLWNFIKSGSADNWTATCDYGRNSVTAWMYSGLKNSDTQQNVGYNNNEKHALLAFARSQTICKEDSDNTRNSNSENDNTLSPFEKKPWFLFIIMFSLVFVSSS